MSRRYQNRAEAGRALADELQHLKERQPLVLALPRGGLPVGYEVAQALDARLDVLLVRKLGVPGREELAFGAIASGGARAINRDVVGQLGIDQQTIDQVVEREQAELRRRAAAYRDDEPEPTIEGRQVIVVDDGLATGATMQAGVNALREGGSASIIVAVPVGPPESVERLRGDADEVICPSTPASFAAVGQWYQDFAQVSDDEVRDYLRRNWEQTPSRSRS